jgi:HAD superfamily hydrolase (TIGR01509 family)
MTSIGFDLEGTLVRSVDMKEEAMLEFRQRTREKLLELGIPAKVLAGVESSVLMRNRASLYANANLSNSQRQKLESGLNEFLLRFELRWADDSMLFPDAEPTIRILKERGVRMVIVTNTSRPAAELMLTKHTLSNYFDVVVTRNDVSRLKPDPEGLLIAFGRLGERAEYFVGDTGIDSEAARNAGIKSIIVRRNWPQSLVPPDPHADHKVESLTEIVSMINGGSE